MTSEAVKSTARLLGFGIVVSNVTHYPLQLGGHRKYKVSYFLSPSDQCTVIDLQLSEYEN